MDKTISEAASLLYQTWYVGERKKLPSSTLIADQFSSSLPAGHSKVTRTTNEFKTKLNRWCSQMRVLHQKTVKGEKFGLTKEKMELLNKLDFVYEFDDLPERHSFYERFEWLKQFKEGTSPRQEFSTYLLCVNGFATKMRF